LRVGFIGGGVMAEAMIGGLIREGFLASAITVSEPVASRRLYLVETFQVAVVESNAEVCTSSDVVVIAVKPQALDLVLAELTQKADVDPKVTACLFLSIVAGKTLYTFQKYMPEARVARIMPNTPAQVGCGASVYVLNSVCTPEDGKLVEAVMKTCGIVERLADEKLMDAITGLSGSGPAYVYLMIEAMSDGGVRMGLPRATATRLAAQTVMGAGQMVLNSGKHPGALKDDVTSPGGTTIAGVHALEAGAFRGTVINAVEAATRRSEELGRPVMPSKGF